METALDYLVSQGVLGVFLVLVVVYFLRKEKKTEETAEIKSLAWSKLVEKKDEKIQELNDQVRNDALENSSLFNEVNRNLSNLVTELNIRNNAKN